MFRSLGRKIGISMILVTLITVVSFFIFFNHTIIRSLENQMDKDGQVVANIVRHDLQRFSSNEKDKVSLVLKEIKEQNKDDIQYISLINPNCEVLVSSDSNVIGDTLKDDENIQKVFSEGEPYGIFTKDLDGTKVYNVYVPAYEQDKLTGVVCVGMSTKDMADILKTQTWYSILMCIVVLIICSIVAFLLTRMLVKPIKVIMKKMKKVAKGDFTVEFHSEGKDEIGELMIALNKVIESLRNMIDKIEEATVSLDSMAQNLTASSEEVASSSEEISRSSEEVSNAASCEAEDVQNITSATEHFSDSMDVIGSKLGEIKNSGDKIKEDAEKGNVKIKELVKSTEIINNSFNISSEKISTLIESVRKITEITDVINAVAEQTNLLALNAAIEASRAGEAGRGFSVVAEEIRKLAEQVLESSKNINSLVNFVTSDTEEVAKTTQGLRDKINVQTESIQNTATSFENILHEVEGTVPRIDGVYKALDSNIDKKDEIIASIQNVSGTSEEVSASVEEISASVENQTATIEELSSSAQQLTELADKLADAMSKLKTEEDN
ncbi:methyl-accepting chemotaxis protein [Haloimpatiens sp. FM7330]|uniref:methyl-accepting chemotaxis protein n=1 Tax=Haloimpatiens sp. FM7330 TaxID=3298610 RepID=UPI00363B95D7